MSAGILQVPSIILLAFCLAAPDKDGPCHCSVLSGAEDGEREGQGAEDKGNGGERARDKDTILTFSCGILSPGE